MGSVASGPVAPIESSGFSRLSEGCRAVKAAVEVANEHGWPHDWLNSYATVFLPSYGADPEWEVLYANEDITVMWPRPGHYSP